MSRIDSDDLEDSLNDLAKNNPNTDSEYLKDLIRKEFDRLTIEAGKATILYSELITRISENISLKLQIEELREEHKQRKQVKVI